MLPHIALTEKTGEKHGGVFLIRIIQNPYFKSSMSCCKINNPQPNKKIDKQPPPKKKNIIMNTYLVLFTNGLMQWHVSL